MLSCSRSKITEAEEENMGGTMNQMKVHFDHKASDMAKTFRMTEADWDIAFNFVYDRFSKKQPTEIIEAVLNRADFSLSQKTVGVYLVGCIVGEERSEERRVGKECR